MASELAQKNDYIENKLISRRRYLKTKLKLLFLAIATCMTSITLFRTKWS